MKLIEMVRPMVKFWPEKWGFITQDPHNKTIYVSGIQSEMKFDQQAQCWMVGDKGSWVVSLGRQTNLADDATTAVITQADLFPPLEAHEVKEPLFTGEIKAEGGPFTGNVYSAEYAPKFNGEVYAAPITVTVNPFNPGDMFKYLVNGKYHICKCVYFGDGKMAWLDTSNNNQLDSIDDYLLLRPVKLDEHAARLLSLENDIAELIQKRGAGEMNQIPYKLACDIADDLLCTYDIVRRVKDEN